MKIGLVHLTDFHFKPDTCLQVHAESIGRVIAHEFASGHAIIALTGDLAFSGQATEYERVSEFLRTVQRSARTNSPTLQISYAIVPGNHDCDFNGDDRLRALCINSIQDEYTDAKVVNACIGVQEAFWTFVEKFYKETEDKLYHVRTISEGGLSIGFHCFNSAWVSRLSEKPGGLFFPISRYESVLASDKSDIRIALIHHPLNWFDPSGNKQEIEKIFESHFAMVLVGHEHENHQVRSANLQTGSEVFLLQGSNLYKNSTESEFQICVFESSRTGVLKEFFWTEGLYQQKGDSQEITFYRNRSRELKPVDDYMKDVNMLSIPLAIEKKEANLSDIFVYPNLESAEIDGDTLENYMDSSTLLSDSSGKKWLLVGDSQSGKTSLLNRLFLDSVNAEKYPLLIRGDEISNDPTEDVLLKSFKKTYGKKKELWSRFSQKPVEEKVLFIDDFQGVRASGRFKERFVNEIAPLFGVIVISIDALHGAGPMTALNVAGYKRFRIKSFGYKKTNELIERYHSLMLERPDEEGQALLEKTKLTLDRVLSVVGNKIIPSYPIYLLSIIQALESALYDLNKTSHAYCYQTLIHLALSRKGGVSNDDMSTYFNILQHLAHWVFFSDEEIILAEDLLEFYRQYAEKFIAPPYEEVVFVCTNSQLLTKANGEYRFAYKYILYFLAAKQLADTMDSDQVKSVIARLFENLHVEKNANILVFITHHTNDKRFIDDAILSAMGHFEDLKPITLDTDDEFYDQINGVAEDIASNIIHDGVDPRKHILDELSLRDQAEREKESRIQRSSDVAVEIQNAIEPFIKAFRSIDIGGQIYKNRKGALGKEQIVDMITELYQSGFRTIAYAKKYLDNEKDDLMLALKTQIEDDLEKRARGRSYILDKGVSDSEIQKIVRKFLQMMGLEVCLAVFSRLIYSVGIKDMQEIYRIVAVKIGTPAARLVSFSINSYYNPIRIEELKDIVKEFEANPLAMLILKARIRSYVYHNHINYADKQRIAQCMGMQLLAPVQK